MDDQTLTDIHRGAKERGTSSHLMVLNDEGLTKIMPLKPAAYWKTLRSDIGSENASKLQARLKKEF